MKTAHLLVMAVSLVVVGGGLYAALTHLGPQPRNTAPTVPVASRPQAPAGEGGPPGELSPLRGKEADGGTVKKLAEDLSRLRTEVARLHDQVQQCSATAAAAAGSRDDTSSGDSPPLTEGDMELITQAREQEELKRRASIDADFQAESVDPQWASPTAGLLTQVLGHEELALTEVVDMDCRTTLCRLTLSHADAEAANQFDLVFPMQVAEALPQTTYFHQQLADGRIDTVLYLGRKG